MAKIINKIVVWGDSIAKGVAYDDVSKRYTKIKENFVNLFAEKTGIEILNRAKMGMTIDKGREFIESDISKGITADAAIVEFGGNDSDCDWAAVASNPDIDHDPKTPLCEFENHLRSIIDLLSNKKIPIFLANLPPILSEKYFDFVSQGNICKENILKWLGDKNRIYRFHERYSIKITEFANKYSCKLLDFRSALLEPRNICEYICQDGIHPNKLGQELLSKVALAAI